MPKKKCVVYYIPPFTARGYGKKILFPAFYAWAAVACFAVFLGVAGLLQFQRYSARREAKLQEAGEIMLEIIGMAAADEFYATLET